MKRFFSILFLLIFVKVNALANNYNLDAVRLYNLGIEKYRVGAYSAAIEYFKSATAIQDDFYDAYYNLAVVYDYLGEYTAAIMVMETVLEKKTEDSAFLYKLAQVYYKKGDLKKSSELLDEIAPTSQEYNKARQLADRIGLENSAKIKYSGKDIAAKTVPVFQKIKGINAPTGISVDLNGFVYVASYSDNAIFKLMPNGIHQLYVKNKMINGPIGLASDKNGNMYVANYKNNNILKIDKYGNTTVFVEYSDKPYSVYVKDSVLYVSEQGSNTILTKKLY